MNKNSWLTFHYKNGIIQHGWDEKEHRSVVTVTLPDGALKVVSSLRAAMCILARAEKGAGMDISDISYVKSVLSEAVASCVPDGSLEPPTGARCRTRAGFRAWLRRAKMEMARKGAGK